jgi:hypothetical protein
MHVGTACDNARFDLDLKLSRQTVNLKKIAELVDLDLLPGRTWSKKYQFHCSSPSSPSSSSDRFRIFTKFLST